MKNKIIGWNFLVLILFHIFSIESVSSNDNSFYKPSTLSILTSISLSYVGYQYLKAPEQPSIIVLPISQSNNIFPKNFQWGIATASSQNEESINNNGWSSSYFNRYNKNITPATFGCKSYAEIDDDIEKLAYLGVNAYRFSIEWSRVQPTQDTFDEQAIAHYVQLAQKLRSLGIRPMVCLHHYSDPIWFLDIGGFTKQENIEIFTRFCEKMYHALREYVDQWIIISQPAAYALKGYDQGMQPPFIQQSGLGEKVMLNLFKAHINVYDMMHNNYNKNHIGLEPSIGICHQISQMQAYNFYSPLDHVAATFADRLYNKSLLRFFSTGHFRCLKPLIDIDYIAQAPSKFDFFALSYYSPKGFSGLTPITPRAEKTHLTADSSRIIDKDAMYNALVQAAQLHKPVYVVESGIDPIDEEQRILLLNSYLSAIAQALQNGYDIRGYYYWTLMDNYEWAKPFNSTHFGLYKNRVINEQGDLDPDYKNHAKMLKESGKYYQSVVALHK